MISGKKSGTSLKDNYRVAEDGPTGGDREVALSLGGCVRHSPRDGPRAPRPVPSIAICLGLLLLKIYMRGCYLWCSMFGKLALCTNSRAENKWLKCCSQSLTREDCCLRWKFYNSVFVEKNWNILRLRHIINIIILLLHNVWFVEDTCNCIYSQASLSV